MAEQRNHSSRPSLGGSQDDSILPTRQIEAFSRKVTATASHLMGPLEASTNINHHYQNALGELHREMRRPVIQRSMFSFAQNSPKELIRNVKTSEIQHRTLAYLPDELLAQIPEPSSSYSLFEGFQATLPEQEERSKRKKIKGQEQSRGRKLLTDAERTAESEEDTGPPELVDLKNEKFSLGHKLEMLGVRKSMCASEIREIDTKISNLNTMRRIVLERLATLEQDEVHLEQDILGVDNRLEDLREELEDAAALAAKSPPTAHSTTEEDVLAGEDFMSESIYEKIPSPKTKRRMKFNRRISMPILHEHLESGSCIREMQAHNDMITAIDFDAPFGTMVTSALDDTVRVWDLNAGRCMGFLDGHLSSVRCLQVEDEIVATGSMDATIRLWDLSRAQYAPKDTTSIHKNGQHDDEDEDDGLDFQNVGDEPPPPHANSMSDCPLLTLQAHVDEVTALHFRGNTLVSGSADKTLRQWDLEKGRCVQTLDVLWAAAQASAQHGLHDGQWKGAAGGGRLPDANADFVGALQCFDAALACGTADGMVRLWDLRSGQVHRSLVGHTGPITSLQFDDVHIVTASLDRSIRIWDLRTGSIYDAFAYDNPISSMMFDTRRIVAAAAEPVVKVYDKADGNHWNCGAGAQEDAEGSIANVERVRIKDGYLVEGRRDGVVGVWSC